MSQRDELNAALPSLTTSPDSCARILARGTRRFVVAWWPDPKRLVGTHAPSMLTFDARRFPLVVADLRDELTNEDAALIEHRLGTWFAEGNRFGLACKAVEVGLPDVALLKRLAGWIRANQEGYRAALVCSCLMVPSPMFRGVIAFVNGIVPPPSPQRVFATWPETEAWTIEQMRAEGLSIPAAFDPPSYKDS